MSILNTLALGAITATQAVAPAQATAVHPAPPVPTTKTSNFSIEYQYPGGNSVTRYTGAGAADTGTFVSPFAIDYYMHGSFGGGISYDYLASHVVTIRPANEEDLLKIYPSKESEISLPRITGFIDPTVTNKIDSIPTHPTDWFSTLDKNTGVYSSGIKLSSVHLVPSTVGNEIYGMVTFGSDLLLEVDIDDIYESNSSSSRIEFNTEFFFNAETGLVSPTRTGKLSPDFNVTTVGHFIS